MTSAERTLASLRELILDGDLRPGTRRGEAELADRLGVSRTPVREALSRLAAEGLVEVAPNRGARVATWTVAELEGVFDLRASLEPQLTGFAVARAGSDDVEALDELAQRMLAVGTPGPAQDPDARPPPARPPLPRRPDRPRRPPGAGHRARRGDPPADRAAQLPHLRRGVAA